MCDYFLHQRCVLVSFDESARVSLGKWAKLGKEMKFYV